MNASEVVQPGIVANNSETLRRSTAQVGRTAKSTSLTLAGRMFRNVNDWRVEEAVYGRRSFQAAAIAADVTSSRFLRSQSNVVRAAKNVLEWKEYLPDDCVNAMVARGWHFTV
jgi:hypothetical protein